MRDPVEEFQATSTDEMPAAQPVTVVIKKPDYWSRGHFFEGNGGWVQGAVNVPIGTKLYATPDPRIAVLEGLLRETLQPGAYGIGSTLAERIAAALNKEG